MTNNSLFSTPRHMNKKPPAPHQAERFYAQLRDFFRFLVKPDFRRGYGRGAGNGWVKDWQVNTSWKRMFQWAAFMWAINVLVLAPIALVAAGGVDASHRVHFSYMLVPLAVIWAPIVEEILFRFNIRRPLLALWMMPIMVFVLLKQGTVVGTVCLIAVLAIVMIVYPRFGLDRYGKYWHLPFWFLRLYRQYFVIIMHILVFGFAYMHIFNYEFSRASTLTILVMVMPQWFSGLVLMWMRVRYGIANSIYLHAIFNGGPVFLIVILKLLGVPLD